MRRRSGSRRTRTTLTTWPAAHRQIFIGEYASNEGSPTNDMESALGDASWLLGLERNSDLVTMSSYCAAVGQRQRPISGRRT